MHSAKRRRMFNVKRTEKNKHQTTHETNVDALMIFTGWNMLISFSRISWTKNGLRCEREIVFEFMMNLINKLWHHKEATFIISINENAYEFTRGRVQKKRQKKRSLFRARVGHSPDLSNQSNGKSKNIKQTSLFWPSRNDKLKTNFCSGVTETRCCHDKTHWCWCMSRRNDIRNANAKRHANIVRWDFYTEINFVYVSRGTNKN